MGPPAKLSNPEDEGGDHNKEFSASEMLMDDERFARLIKARQKMKEQSAPRKAAETSVVDTSTNLSRVYVSVATKRTEMSPRLFCLMDHCTVKDFSKQVRLDYIYGSTNADVKYQWFRNQWFRFKLDDEADFEILLGIAKEYRGASGDFLLEVKLPYG
ncbi:MAG: hypothetical protein M1812_007662 [Candelaria pacifica]|nr:MAG: hypothetical protein M1812_007662 [Candelaria pacifica]